MIYGFVQDSPIIERSGRQREKRLSAKKRVPTVNKWLSVTFFDTGLKNGNRRLKSGKNFSAFCFDKFPFSFGFGVRV